MTADDAAQAMAAVALAGASVARAAVEVDRAKWTITALRTERDALAAEVSGQTLVARSYEQERDAARSRLGDATAQIKRMAAENARLRAQVETLRHGVNHPYGGIDGCARCAIATTTTEDRPVPHCTDARALYFPADDDGNPDSWQVQAGEYADEPDLVIVIEHAVSSEGKDRRESVAREVAALLTSRGGPMSDYFEQWEEALRNGLRWQRKHDEAQERIAAALAWADDDDHHLACRIYRPYRTVDGPPSCDCDLRALRAALATTEAGEES